MDVQNELKKLSLLTVRELRERYEELFGEPCRSRNRPHLLKRVGWRIQANAEGGGLSDRAVRRIADLGDALPDRWQQKATEKKRAERPRDPRLPPPGTVLEKVFGSVVHEVTVLDDGFRYQGEFFDSLSTIANKISGSRWNGFSFFRLEEGRP
jgi:hypothetical protein